MIDIRIMAHPSRKENVNYILNRLSLSEDSVVWDDRPGGGDATYTARKAWCHPLPEGCTHRLVLQDDIEICENFLNIVEQVAAKHTDKLVSFFHTEGVMIERYNRTPKVWGQALMFPVHLIRPCWNFIDNTVLKWYKYDVWRHDTLCIRLWAEHHGIHVINTSPSLVQHIGDISLVGIDKERIATDYTKEPPLNGW